MSNATKVPIGDISARMARVMGRMHNPEPKGYNSFHKYHFVSIGQVTDLVRVAMADEGVAFFPSVTNVHEEREGKSTRVVVELQVTFVAAETGEFFRSVWYGEAADTSDKAYNKAYTAALKQCLLKTLLIGEEVEGDADSASPAPPATQKKTTRKNGAPKPAPKPPPEFNEEAWNKANKRYWAVTAELGDEMQQFLHDACKRMWAVTTTRDVPLQKLHDFIHKLEGVEDMAAAAQAMIDKYPEAAQ